MGASVLLLHRLPDGSSHFDWLIQPAGGPDRPLVSFRTLARIDLGTPRAFEAWRLADHRPVYLAYEGPISGGRGDVVRVAAGEIEIERDEPGLFIAVGALGAVRGRFEGRPRGDGVWDFAFTPAPDVVG